MASRVSVTCLRWHSQRDQLEQGLLAPMPSPSAPCLAAAHRSSHVTATAISGRTQRSTYQVPTLLTEPLEAQRGQVKQRKERAEFKPASVACYDHHEPPGGTRPTLHGSWQDLPGRVPFDVGSQFARFCLSGWLVGWVGLVFLLSSVSRNIIQW